jgi:uncharacterized circularly permuted ATP-grasp superfamily protein/uncharacterized alpha-E superfamily protein
VDKADNISPADSTDHDERQDRGVDGLEPSATGHFDELRQTGPVAAASELKGPAARQDGLSAAISPHWAAFFSSLGPAPWESLNRRTESLQRQIRDNGITYNVYADAERPQRPWSLDLFPLIVSPESWRHIESGVKQRVRLLDRLMADVYGPQSLLTRGLLPPALVHGHPGYLRAAHGMLSPKSTHLHIAAFDLARGPDGNWWVVSQRTQAPSGLGYLLENRLAIARLFPEAFNEMKVQRLASTYRALVDNLKQMSPAGRDAHIALLTPGPYSETYFEHAYLARYLGLTLVEGSDLTVRDQRLYLKTLRGLQPVHGLLKRLDDEFLDPLELRSDSRLGVPGLLQAIRAGHVLVANSPGSAFLESPALLGFLPALARHLLGEELALPALPTWWCGERVAMENALPALSDSVIKPTYPGSPAFTNFEAVLGRSLTRRERDEWAGRIMRQPDEHTLQGYLPLSQMPTWNPPEGKAGPAGMVPRSVMLRVFAVADGPQSWRVLSGGLARMVSATAEIATMQRGGSSADVWVMTDVKNGAQVDPTTLLQSGLSASSITQRKRLVTSRAAENLFWLGRYSERAENTVRLAELTLECLHGEHQSTQPLLLWLSQMAAAHGLVLPAVPPASQARRVFERSLIAGLGEPAMASSVGFNLRAIKSSAFAVRERLSPAQWQMIVLAEQEFSRRCAAQAEAGDYSSIEALRTLAGASAHLAAITGAQTDRMTRDDGWRLLSIGRHVERLGFLADALASGLETGAVHTEGGFDAVIALFDSTITFRSLFQQSHELAALLDLLVVDRDNPRSLGWVVQTLRGRLAKLGGFAPGVIDGLSLQLPDPSQWDLVQLCEPHSGALSHPLPSASSDAMPETKGGPPGYPALAALLQHCRATAYRISDQIGATYFTHSAPARQTGGPV